MKVDIKVAHNYLSNYEVLKFELVELLVTKSNFLEEDTIFSVDFYEYRVLVELTITKSVKHLKILNIILTC